MSFDPQTIRAVVFDYGNTLIPFNKPQVQQLDQALARALEQHCGPIDLPRFLSIRARDRVWPYQGDYRERDSHELCCSWVTTLYGRQPDEAVMARLLEAKVRAFVDVAAAPDYVHRLLGQLKQRYRLGLLSNYPDAPAIRETVRKLGLDEYLECVVVSADVGHVKPHPRPFQAVLDQLQVPADQTLFVGDNWLGDVQGAKRMGMAAAYLCQFEQAEPFHPQPGDAQPDLRLNHLLELEAALLGG